MARKTKFPDNRKARFTRSHSRGRSTGTRFVRKRYLIVCEGAETEPKYFKTIEKSLPKGSVKVEGEGFNTLSLVEDAERRAYNSAKRNMPYDKVWVVFDRDSFSASNFDNAINKAKAKKFGCAWSNEAFELWYILHFEFRNTGMNRNQYKSRLTAHLGEEYKKNDPDMYRKIIDKQQDAIRNATRLLEIHGSLPRSRCNPATTVHVLVQELLALRSR